MKNMRKLASLLLALVMVFAMATTAFAASITIDPKLPTDGTTEGVTYNAYKIFDATISGENYSYTIDSTSPYYTAVQTYVTLTQINGTTTYAVDTTTLEESEMTAFAAAVLEIAKNQTASGEATTTGEKATISGLDEGYYLVTSTLGSAVMVQTLGDVEIDTKNSYPTVGKTEDKETAAYGETVTYTVPVTIPATAVGAIVLHDTMTNLTYNEDVTANVGETPVTVTAATDVECEKGCTVHFTLSAGVVADNLGETVTLTYSADVVAEMNVGTNEVQLEYGNYWSPEYEVEVKNYKVDVYKTDGTNGLAGAGFVLVNEDDEYYSKNAEGEIVWVESEDDALELFPVADTYTVTFDGLANGTYTLIESTVPDGYTQADDKEVVIKDADLIGEKKITVVNRSGQVLPSTGGMGTTLFYIVGGILVVAAVVLLVTKKRMAVAE